MDTLKPAMEKVIQTLQDPAYHEVGQQSRQREDIWKIVKDVFNFKEISMRTLARSWKKFTPEQRTAFTEVFSELLRNTYLGKLQGEYHNEKVVFAGEDTTSSKKAVVKTIIHRGDTEIPMHYRMIRRNGVWGVYDVNIEGVSLVKNYRRQFKKILARETPDVLIQRLKEKNAENQRQLHIKEQAK